jgi:hypothetical protein
MPVKVMMQPIWSAVSAGEIEDSVLPDMFAVPDW